MGYLLIFSIIFTFATTLTILLKKRIEEMLPISIVTIILIIYIAGIFDNLNLGVIIVQILTIFQLIGIVFITLKKNKNEIKEIVGRLLTPGLFVYALLFIISIIINKNRIFEDYDEFSHWGLIIKNMFNYNTYGTNAESIVRFNEYPPFTAVFQYLFLNIQKIYREDTIIIAQNILYFSIIIPITKSINWNKSIKKLLAIIPIIVFLPMFFYDHFFLNILVDGMLGIMFTYVIFAAYEEDEIVFQYTKILIGLVMLCLTKTTGIALAVVAIITILIKKLMNNKNNKDKLKKEMISFIIVIAIVTILTSIWYIKIKNVETKWEFEKIVQVEETKVHIQEQIFKEFINALMFYNQITPRGFTVWTALIILLLVQLYAESKIKNENYKYYSRAFFVIIPIYLIGLCISYMTIFDVIEAQHMTCFDRYVGTIFLAFTMFQMLAITQLEKWDKKMIFITVSIILTLIPLATIRGKYFEGKSHIEMAEKNREMYTKMKRYEQKLKTTDKILYITSESVNLQKMLAINNYTIMPIKIENIIIGSFNEAQELEKIAKDYTYIYLYKMSEDCKNNVREVFEDEYIKNNTLYKVDKENEKIILKKQ